jgi:indole-3-glycerol phosphate synthase
MVTAVPDVLARIVEQKRTEIPAKLKRQAELEAKASALAGARRDFRQALVRPTPAVIAEIKKASPSKGLLRADFEPRSLARAYNSGGAAALSVLTDGPFFQGSLADMEAVRATVDLPVLRKDFTLEEIDVIEAAANGADAVLLIAAILTAAEMRRLREAAASYSMAALVEVHDEGEMGRAIESGAGIIGVNNRNLHNFEVTLDTSLRLASMMPSSAVRVSESGIHSAADIHRLSEAGFHAFLIGEGLMKSPDPEHTLRCLLA